MEQAEIQYEPNGRSRKSGVVRFDNAENADIAITKFSGYPYGGRPLGLSFAKYTTPGTAETQSKGLTQERLMYEPGNHKNQGNQYIRLELGENNKQAPPILTSHEDTIFDMPSFTIESDSDDSPLESTLDDLSKPLSDFLEESSEEMGQILDEGLVGLSDIALLVLQENAHLDQDLINPSDHQKMLQDLLILVCKGSVAVEFEIKSVRALTGTQISTHAKLPVNLSLDTPTTNSQYLKCLHFVDRILTNVRVLQQQGFCTTSINFLRTDPVRDNVAILSTLDLNRIQKLISVNHKSGSEQDLKLLDGLCQGIFDPAWISNHASEPGFYTYTIIRVLDMIVL